MFHKWSRTLQLSKYDGNVSKFDQLISHFHNLYMIKFVLKVRLTTNPYRQSSCYDQIVLWTRPMKTHSRNCCCPHLTHTETTTKSKDLLPGNDAIDISAISMLKCINAISYHPTHSIPASEAPSSSSIPRPQTCNYLSCVYTRLYCMALGGEKGS